MKILITGSSGLIGSQAVSHFGAQGHQILGLDANLRPLFFGATASTDRNKARLERLGLDLRTIDLDIRSRERILELYRTERPDATIHCAAQPSHDLAARMPLDDFDINAVGTLNLLEAARRYVPDAPFVHMSTNKVYGDGPNRIAMEEGPMRWDFADADYEQGIPEDFPIDGTLHSLFGASKAAADLMVQEYGRYYGMPTVSFRGGCLTGPYHSGVELHGFLSYLVRVAVRGQAYTVFGHGGKQVRDQIHSEDVVLAFEAFINDPIAGGAVFNLGGGKENSASILECIELIRQVGGYELSPEYSQQARKGDHICYYSDLRRFRAAYPQWTVRRNLRSIVEEMIRREEERVRTEDGQ